MKKFTLLLSAILMSLAMLAQAPAGINYQTVIRDGDGNILPDTELSLQMTIRTGAPDGEVVYTETHDVTTNAFGLVNLVIGSGTPQNGTFDEIAWGDGDKYLETAIDVDGGETFTILGVTQFLSVPYAYEANRSKSLVLSDENGNEYEIKVDTLGNLSSTIIEIVWECGDILIDSRDGQQYETVEIGDQCWMAENLNIGERIEGTEEMPDNGTIEKYCYNNSDAQCDTYGGLYQWNEMMQYTTTAGVQGICPDGWHLPTDAEWCTLEQEVDPTITCSSTGLRGIDGGGKLKETGTTHWNSPNTSATNSSGFMALPGGYRDTNGSFYSQGDYGFWWSSSEFDASNAWRRYLYYNNAQVSRNNNPKSLGFSARCLQDESSSTVYNLSLEALPPEAGTVTGTGQYEANEQVSVSAEANSGWEFVNWTDNDGIVSEVANFTYTMPAEDIFLTANFVEEQVGFTCGDLLLDARDGQQYETVEIGNQCWMAENLNYETGNSWCYDNDPSNCATYGRLYDWETALGVCPSGWRLPSDEEWKILEGTVDSQYPVGDPEWDGTDIRGLDAGDNLKSTSGWNHNGNGTDLYGFGALPGGIRSSSGSFTDLGDGGNWWSSSEYSGSNAWYRYLHYQIHGSIRYSTGKTYGSSMRCLRDIEQQNQAPELPSAPAPENSAVNQTIESNLSWTCTDPEGDPLTYDVYFGAESTPPMVSSGQTEVIYDPGILENSTQYFWKIIAHDNQGNTTEGEVWSFTTETESIGFSCGDNFTDTRDGQNYTTVLIGDQCWFKENLAYLPEVSPSSQGNNTDPYYYVYDYQGTDVAEAKATENYQNYGSLYNWPASLTVCPTDWHLPTDAEWTVLTDHLGGTGVAGGKMKSTRTAPDPHPRWNSPNTGATNTSGFSGLPGGICILEVFGSLGDGGYFWSSTEYNSYNARCRSLLYNNDDAERSQITKGFGFSVRCLRDL